MVIVTRAKAHRSRSHALRERAAYLRSLARTPVRRWKIRRPGQGFS